MQCGKSFSQDMKVALMCAFNNKEKPTELYFYVGLVA